MPTELVKVDPTKLVADYSSGFSRLLPSHMREDGGGDQWVAAVKSLLATKPEIAQAASNSRDHFLAALIQAAQKGLMPGTKEFHLVPFAQRKGEPRIINGVEGYQGIVERIYRAGAVATVIAEAIYSNDEFDYQPGYGQPKHVVDWFGDRGELKGAYAYALFRDGAVSKVVVVGRKEIAQAKAKSASANSEYSPWKQFPEAMWVKTAVRKLENWVPTSAEYRRQQLRDAQAVMDERQRTAQIATQFDDVQMPAAAVAMAHDEDELIDEETGEIIDAELVEDRGADQAPEGTDGGGEALSVPAGAGVDEGAGSRGAAGARTPSKARPAAEGTASSVDAPVPASQAGVGDVAAVPSPTAAASAPTVQQFDPGAEWPVMVEGSGVEQVHSPAPILTRQKQELRAECARLGIQSNTAEKLMWFDLLLGYEDGTVTAPDALNRVEAEKLLGLLKGFADHAAVEAWGAGQTSLVEEG